jgi:manganese-dependent ADP-ribose/CDP-alcohol diphosphatase
LRIGILADIQYSDEDHGEKCYYRDSLVKLEEAVADFNLEKLDFVVQLGDLINKDMNSFSPVLSRLNQLEPPIYHLLGNHDFIVNSAEKSKIPALLSMAGKYYSYKRNGWLFIFLDGNDISLNAHPEESLAHKESQLYFDSYKGISEWWNGAISGKQLSWLDNQLQSGSEEGLNIGLFCHFPIQPESRFSLWNSSEVMDLLKKYENVKFWMNGHHHEGAYDCVDDIHFLTYKGMVENTPNSYGILEIAFDKISIIGNGNECDRVLSI